MTDIEDRIGALVCLWNTHKISADYVMTRLWAINHEANMRVWKVYASQHFKVLPRKEAYAILSELYDMTEVVDTVMPVQEGGR